jgi:hypothetical protein
MHFNCYPVFLLYFYIIYKITACYCYIYFIDCTYGDLCSILFIDNMPELPGEKK